MIFIFKNMYFDDVDLKIMGNSLRTHYISVENLWKLSKYANKVSKKMMTP